jgi:hypothetical protein
MRERNTPKVIDPAISAMAIIVGRIGTTWNLHQ